jgi:hypothetical protein
MQLEWFEIVSSFRWSVVYGLTNTEYSLHYSTYCYQKHLHRFLLTAPRFFLNILYCTTVLPVLVRLTLLVLVLF